MALISQKALLLCCSHNILWCCPVIHHRCDGLVHGYCDILLCRPLDENSDAVPLEPACTPWKRKHGWPRFDQPWTCHKKQRFHSSAAVLEHKPRICTCRSLFCCSCCFCCCTIMCDLLWLRRTLFLVLCTVQLRGLEVQSFASSSATIAASLLCHNCRHASESYSPTSITKGSLLRLLLLHCAVAGSRGAEPSSGCVTATSRTSTGRQRTQRAAGSCAQRATARAGHVRALLRSQAGHASRSSDYAAVFRG